MGHWDQGRRKLDGHRSGMESMVDPWCSTGAPGLVRHYQVVVALGMHIWNVWWVLWWSVAHVQLLVPKSVTWRCTQTQGGRGQWLCCLVGSSSCCSVALGNPSSRSFCWSMPGRRGERWQFGYPTFEITGKNIMELPLIVHECGNLGGNLGSLSCRLTTSPGLNLYTSCLSCPSQLP